MSTSYTIHVRPTSSVSTDEFVKDAVSAIGTELAPSAYGEGFEGFTPAGAIEIFTGGPPFDDEGGIPLSLYPWFIEMVKPKADDERDGGYLPRCAPSTANWRAPAGTCAAF